MLNVFQCAPVYAVIKMLMTLESLNDTKIDLPSQEEFAYESNGFLFLGKRASLQEGHCPKYLVQVSQGGKNIGRFSFFVLDQYFPEIVFEGMLLDHEYRSRGISDKFMEELFRIAVSSGRELNSAAPQRKPLMCRILHKHGFQPVVENPKRAPQETVFVGRGEVASSVYVYFPSAAKERNFRNSHIFRSQSYEIVSEIGKIRDSVMCLLNVPYLRCV